MDWHCIKLFLLFSLFQTVSTSTLMSCYYRYNQPPPSLVDVSLCSHVILIGNTELDALGHFQRPPVEISKGLYSLKKRNPDIKLLICLTGTNAAFSTLVSSSETMSRFANESRSYLAEYRLDGIDLDWEFPTWSWDARRDDKFKFTTFLKILRDSYQNNFLMTAAVSGPPTISRVAYDVTGLNKYVDLIQVMNYDFHVFSYLHPIVGFNAPLRKLRGELGIIGEMNSESSMLTWDQLGLWRNKTLFGIPTYNLAFILVNSYMNLPYALAENTVDAYGSQADVCELLRDEKRYTYVWNEKAASPYIHGTDKLWVSIEDERSVAAKTEYAMDLDVAGVMVFHIGGDDVHGSCRKRPYPLLTKINDVIKKHEMLKSNSIL